MPKQKISGLLPSISVIQIPAIVRKKPHQFVINWSSSPTRTCPSTKYSPPFPSPPPQISPNKWFSSLLNVSRFIGKEKYYMNLQGTSFPPTSRKLSNKISRGSWRYLWRWVMKNFKISTIKTTSRHSVASNASWHSQGRK